MLGGLFGGGLFGQSGVALTQARSDSLLYAVGDVHGRADLLIPLVERLLRDAVGHAAALPQKPEIVFVGDLIDRGPDSRSVIEFLIAMQEWPEIRPIFLVGNHELMMLQFLDNPVEGRRWLRHGGYETLLSYEIGDIGDLGDADQLKRIADRLRDAMGPHLDFIENLEAWHVNGNLLLTHAGAQPSLPPSEQPIDALVWGAPEFFRARREDGLWVVHGHTVVEEPSLHQGRIAIDTGAYRTGRLTALRANGEEIGFFTQRGAAAQELDEVWDD